MELTALVAKLFETPIELRMVGICHDRALGRNAILRLIPSHSLTMQFIRNRYQVKPGAACRNGNDYGTT